MAKREANFTVDSSEIVGNLPNGRVRWAWDGKTPPDYPPAQKACRKWLEKGGTGKISLAMEIEESADYGPPGYW